MAASGKCISCGAMLEMGSRRRLVCPYCGTTNIIDKTPPHSGMIVCAQCGNENPTSSEHCSECGADLYYHCPKCSTRNTAEAVHCVKCGVNIAQAIKNWQQEQAQLQERLEAKKKKQKKTRMVLFIIILNLLVLFTAVATIISISEKRSQERYNAERTATAEYLYEVSPFKWEGKNGSIAVMFEPELTKVDDGMFLWFTFYNHTVNKCTIQPAQIFAVDELDNEYWGDGVWNAEEYILEVGPESSYQADVVLHPWLASGAQSLTIYFPEYCGVPDGIIVVDLTSPDILIKTE